MENPTLAPVLAWLVERVPLEDDVRAAVLAKAPTALAEGAADPSVLAQALLDAEHGGHAARLIACALPPREGVWWAWLSARHATQLATGKAEEHGALAAVERWVSAPTDEHRRAAWAAAETAGLDTPAGCAAAAVFFTGGSVTPAGGPYVPPPAGVHAILAGAAVLLASARQPDQAQTLLPAFVKQGMEVVRRLGGWDATTATARQTFDAQAAHHADATKPPAPAAAP